MTELKIILCAIMFGTITTQAQQKDNTTNLISKGTFLVGTNSSFGLGFSIHEGAVFAPRQLKPNIGYFIFDRFSVGLSYEGSGFGSRNAPRLRIFHSGEIDLNYYFFAKKNILLYSQSGLAFGNLNPITNGVQKNGNLHLKLGGGASFAVNTFPNLRFNIEAAYYLGPNMQNDFQKIPNLTCGVSYFFSRKKSTGTK
jgi:hypothetical protein